MSTYRQFVAGRSRLARVRARARDGAVRALSWRRSVPGSSWIRFPYYHHVFDDERAGFEAHLRYMRSLATIISLDDAVALLDADTPLDGRFICLSFDDGYKSCVTNALPILAEHKAPATFFVATAFVGVTDEARQPALLGRIGAYDSFLTEFLTWDDCRRLVGHGMTIGSHSVTHPCLIDLSAPEVEQELRRSKDTIERELGVECRHFSAPKGRPGAHFLPGRDPDIAARVGYRSFSTTARGSVQHRPSPMLIPRDHTIASWPLHQLRYFFSR